MPFGLQGAPATFQRMINKILNQMGDVASAYINDVIVYSRTWQEHLDHMKAVLSKIQQSGLTLKRKKCQFAMPECVYLGHSVGSGRVCPEDVKVEAIGNFEQPTTKTQVHSFLGLTGYYRRFIPEYSAVAAPLTDLIRKNQPNAVDWSPLCQRAFCDLKTALCSKPVLKSPDFDRPFILQTDASRCGVGALLSQRDDCSNDRPVAYYSQKLLPCEEKYSAIEKECLARDPGIQSVSDKFPFCCSDRPSLAGMASEDERHERSFDALDLVPTGLLVFDQILSRPREWQRGWTLSSMVHQLMSIIGAGEGGRGVMKLDYLCTCMCVVIGSACK